MTYWGLRGVCQQSGTLEPEDGTESLNWSAR